MEQDVFRTSDLYVVAYLYYRGHAPAFEIEGAKVYFVFPGSAEILRLINEFNSDAPVPVSEYSRAVKRVRAAMLQRRQGA